MDNASKQASRRPVLEAMLIGIKLLTVCAVVAALISGVNALTEKKYHENLTEQKRQAIVRIFESETVSYRALSPQGETEAVYEVCDGGQVIGYCVEVAPSGFGGAINMTVGYHADGSVKGVGIVSLSETPGLGSKVNDADYLSQYVGQTGALELGAQIDAIAGATISSTAVMDGVNRATELLNGYLGGDAQ